MLDKKDISLPFLAAIRHDAEIIDGIIPEYLREEQAHLIEVAEPKAIDGFLLPRGQWRLKSYSAARKVERSTSDHVL